MSLTQEILKIVRKIDKNTRGLAKVVSAEEYLDDRAERSEIIDGLRFAIVQDRRNLRVQLEDLLKQQPGWGKK